MNHIYSRSNGIVLSHIAHVADVLKTSGGELAGLRRSKTKAALVTEEAQPEEAGAGAPEKQGRGKKAKADGAQPLEGVEIL